MQQISNTEAALNAQSSGFIWSTTYSSLLICHAVTPVQPTGLFTTGRSCIANHRPKLHSTGRSAGCTSRFWNKHRMFFVLIGRSWPAFRASVSYLYYIWLLFSLCRNFAKFLLSLGYDALRHIPHEDNALWGCQVNGLQGTGARHYGWTFLNTSWLQGRESCGV